jgi:hypothetical protein
VQRVGQPAGGVVGTDNASDSFSNVYWDLDKGVANPSQGAGNEENDAGIVGLTEAELKAHLPTGFSRTIWNQDQKTNDGFPFLKAIP